jgi:hypothetical protein
MTMERGYPTETQIDSFLADRGLEVVPAGTSPCTANPGTIGRISEEIEFANHNKRLKCFAS